MISDSASERRGPNAAGSRSSAFKAGMGVSARPRRGGTPTRFPPDVRMVDADLRAFGRHSGFDPLAEVRPST
jgi:hypothetical protein